jgi:hypothetical protein
MELYIESQDEPEKAVDGSKYISNLNIVPCPNTKCYRKIIDCISCGYWQGTIREDDTKVDYMSSEAKIILCGREYD